MTRYLVREIAGWIFIGLGLLAYFETYRFLTKGQIFESAPMFMIGTLIFRGGIHLLKVAVAADICLRAERETKAVPTTAPRRPTALPVRVR